MAAVVPVIRINQKGWCAVKWRILGGWEFFPLTKTGRISKSQRSVIVFRTQMVKAIRFARKQGHKIPQSGWRQLSGELPNAPFRIPTEGQSPFFVEAIDAFIQTNQKPKS